MASYPSSDAACAPPESEQGGVINIYVAALDFDRPDFNVSDADAYQDWTGNLIFEPRTLFQIYKHKNPRSWKPSVDRERISLALDYMKIREYNLNQQHLLPDAGSIPTLEGLVFKYPFKTDDPGSNYVDRLMQWVPHSVSVVDFGPSLRMPEEAFHPFLSNRIVNGIVRFLAVKGVCTDFFEKLATIGLSFTLHTTILTVAQMPCDWEIQPHLGDISHVIRFDGRKSKVFYSELGDEEQRRVFGEDDPDDSERSFYLVEPTLVALQSYAQVMLINTLEFAEDSGRYLDRLLGEGVNNATEELVLVISTVVWPDMSRASDQRPSTSADSQRRGRGASGEGSASSYEDWNNAFTALVKRYRRLNKFRIIFTDLRVYVIENEKSYATMRSYMNDLAWNLGTLNNSRPGLLSAANKLHCDNKNLQVEVCLHQILLLLHPQKPIEFQQRHVGAPWQVKEREEWPGRQGGGKLGFVTHADNHNKKGTAGRLYFDCTMQVAECRHPGNLARSGNVPTELKRIFGHSSDGTVYQKIDVRALTPLKQREWSSYAIKHYKLDKQHPCIFTEEEWAEVDPFWFLADPPIRANTIAKVQYAEDNGQDFTLLEEQLV